MALWVAVHGFGEEDLIPEVLNRPIFELTERTNYLKQKIDELRGAGIYESLRIPDVPLKKDVQIGDVVYLNPTTYVFEKAIAKPLTNDTFYLDPAAHAVGVVVSKTSDTQGTVVLNGKIKLSTDNAPWGLDEFSGFNGPLLEKGEKFRNGAYYLSSSEPGKLTAYPKGPHIYIGYFIKTANENYAILNPEYKSLADAHTHSSVVINTIPVGQHIVTFQGTDVVISDNISQQFSPEEIHKIKGYAPDNIPVDTTSTDFAYLNIHGDWHSFTSVQYQIRLANLSNTAVPNSWTEAYIHWASSDVNEGSGFSKIIGYDTVVPVGKNGLKISLSCINASRTHVPRMPNNTICTWTISAPAQIRGWCARHWCNYFSPLENFNDAANINFALSGTNYNSALKVDKIYLIVPKFWKKLVAHKNTLVLDGAIISAGNHTFELRADNNMSNFNNIHVKIPTNCTFEQAVSYLIAAGKEYFYNIPAPFVFFYNKTATDDIEFYICSETNITITAAPGCAFSAATTTSGTGTGTIGSAAIGFAYNSLYQALSDSFLLNYYSPVSLYNGLFVELFPEMANGDPTATLIQNTLFWYCDIIDEAPGAYFVYPFSRDASLLKYFPNNLEENVSLVLNGVELDNRYLFKNSGIYSIGKHGIYWYSNKYNTVPWHPRLFSFSALNAGTNIPLNEQYRCVLHLILKRGFTGVVNSLRAAENAPIIIRQCNSLTPATTGDLEIDLNLTLNTQNQNLSGYTVVKGVVGNNLLLGNVVEKIIPGANIEIQSLGNDPYGQGRVVISSTTSPIYSGDFEEIALENAKQYLIGMFPYIRLLGWNSRQPNNIYSGFVAKFKVPETVLLSDLVLGYRVAIYATIFGTESIPENSNARAAGISFNYSILPDYTYIGPGSNYVDVVHNNLQTGLIKRKSPLNTMVMFGNTQEKYTAYDPFLIHNDTSNLFVNDISLKRQRVFNDPFPTIDDAMPPDNSGIWAASDFVVRPGALVGISISRCGVDNPDIEYVHPIGIINLRWRLIPVMT